VKASLLPRVLVRRCEELDRRDSEKLDNSCSFNLSLSLSLFASSAEIEKSKNPFLEVALAIAFGSLHLLGEELPIAQCQRRGNRKEKEEEKRKSKGGDSLLCQRGDMNAALGFSVWPSSSSSSSSSSLLLSFLEL
jgi:hypothetical protein